MNHLIVTYAILKKLIHMKLNVVMNFVKSVVKNGLVQTKNVHIV